MSMSAQFEAAELSEGQLATVIRGVRPRSALCTGEPQVILTGPVGQGARPDIRLGSWAKTQTGVLSATPIYGIQKTPQNQSVDRCLSRKSSRHHRAALFLLNYCT